MLRLQSKQCCVELSVKPHSLTLKYCNESVYLLAYPRIQTSRDVLYMLTVAVAQFSSDNSTLQYVRLSLQSKQCCVELSIKPHSLTLS